MRTARSVSLILALAVLAAPAPGQTDPLPGRSGSRAAAVDAASEKVGEMSRLLSVSREKPERAVKAWDGLTAELWESWREGTPPAGAAGGSGERRARSPHEAFLAEWTSGGRELLVFRQGLVQRTDGLQAAIDAFPARRTEWLARMEDASKRMGLGEKALAEAAPKAAAVQEALERTVVAKNVAVNVAADTQALRDQAQREYGKKETMPAPVTNVLGRFAKVTELHPGVPEAWQRAMLDAAASVRKAFDLSGATRAKYDATYGVLVQQQLFEPVGRFKGLAFKDLPGPPTKLEADLRALLKKLGERKVTPEDLEKEKQRNATECAAYDQARRETDAATVRTVELQIARVCGPAECRDAILEAARGPCSPTNVRDDQLEYARLSAKRAEKQEQLRKRLELEVQSGAKGFDAKKRLDLLAEIEALDQPSAEELEMKRNIERKEKGQDPDCLAANRKATERCDPDSDHCRSGRAEYEAKREEILVKARKMEESRRDREKRRKALGLPPDPLWQDCPGR